MGNGPSTLPACEPQSSGKAEFAVLVCGVASPRPYMSFGEAKIAVRAFVIRATQITNPLPYMSFGEAKIAVRVHEARLNQ